MDRNIKCPKCNKEDSRDGPYCTFCGTDLPVKILTPPIMQVKPDDLIKASRRKIMEEKQEKAPKLLEKEKYICPVCLKESLTYHEEERLFICECGTKFALRRMK